MTNVKFTIFNEVFNKPYSYTKVKQGKFLAEIPPPKEKQPTIYSKYLPDEEDEERYLTVDFIPIGDNQEINIRFDVDDNEEMTGAGDAFRIMATVKKIILDEIP